MSYSSYVLDGLFALRWGKNPHVEDVARYTQEIAAARKAQGHRLAGLFIMPEDSAPPDDAFRKAQAEALPTIMMDLDFAVAVFEGTGFFSSLKRSALVGILLLSPKKHPVYVRSSVEDALIARAPGKLHFDPGKAIQELKKRKIC